MKARAIKKAFYAGALVKPGDVLEFPLAEGAKLPRWLEPASQPVKASVAAPLNGDTKPAAAAVAARKKAGGADLA
jgi:hypothetical protein